MTLLNDILVMAMIGAAAWESNEYWLIIMPTVILRYVFLADTGDEIDVW